MVRFSARCFHIPFSTIMSVDGSFKKREKEGKSIYKIVWCGGEFCCGGMRCGEIW